MPLTQAGEITTKHTKKKKNFVIFASFVVQEQPDAVELDSFQYTL